MRELLDRFRLLVVLSSAGLAAASAVLVSACGLPAVQIQCESAFDCTSTVEPCKAWVCEQHQCVAQDAPAGTLPPVTESVPPCHRLVCDGHGGEVVEIDPSGTPPQVGLAPCQRAACDAAGNIVMMPDPTAVPADYMPGDCQRPVCGAGGNVGSVPDPTDLPPDTHGDCRRPTCDASGTPSFTPDPTDLPPDTPGDCKTPTCDATGNLVFVPAADPPATSGCTAYTCKNGMAVGSPANQGKSCSPEGFVCSPTGTCDVCPAADAACTDPGPGAAAHSLATAHDLGTIGWCDTDGFGLCGALSAGVTSYFGYRSDGSFSFCSFDPYVRVQASAPVTLCEYFECPSVTCPASSKPATLGALPGCCITGAATEMAIVPSCSDSQVYITVESTSAACTTYMMGFHS